MSEALSSGGTATLVGSTNSAAMTVLATHVARVIWASRPKVKGIPWISISKSGLVRFSSPLSHSLLHFWQTTLTRRLPAWPCFLVSDVTGCNPFQLVCPWLCVSVGERGKNRRSQSGKICSLVRRVPDAPLQKMHLAATVVSLFGSSWAWVGSAKPC